MPPFGAVADSVSCLPSSINLTGCIGRTSVPLTPKRMRTINIAILYQNPISCTDTR